MIITSGQGEYDVGQEEDARDCGGNSAAARPHFPSSPVLLLLLRSSGLSARLLRCVTCVGEHSHTDARTHSITRGLSHTRAATV